jgi:Holliday junction DNA helicase RuvA
MIGKLVGVVDSISEDQALVDVNGVGYVVFCSATMLRDLPSPGSAVTLYVETHVREDSIKLFGFKDWLEKGWFVHLQGVQGVGARVALAILDSLSPSELQQAVALQDKSVFVRANGVGPKLAARIVTELKDKRPPAPHINLTAQGKAYISPSSEFGSSSDRADGLADIVLRNDAASALVNLGYGEVVAGQAVAGAYVQFDINPSLDALIKAALQEIAP